MTSDTLRVLALVPYPLRQVPGQRYRIEQWAPAMKEEGLRVTFRPFLPMWGLRVLYQSHHTVRKALAVVAGCVRRLRDLSALGVHDVVYVYREAALVGPPWVEVLCGSRRPVVFDFDDAIFLRDTSPANRWVAGLRPRGKTASLCRRATHVIVANDYLAAYGRSLARRLTVVPSTIDTDRYRPLGRRANERPVVGWSGSVTTADYLRSLHPALVGLRRRIDFRLRVIGASVDLPGLDVESVPWNADTEADDLRPLDVGVMPLHDDEWSRGKSGMKALQYMALGIPPVVSPIGANAEIVRDGHNGLHASDQETWIDAITRLLSDAGLRARLGAAARRTVEERYSTRVQAPRVAAVLRDAREAGPARGRHGE